MYKTSTRRIYKQQGKQYGKAAGKRIGALYGRSFAPRGSPWRPAFKATGKWVGKNVGRGLGKLGGRAIHNIVGDGAYYTTRGALRGHRLGSAKEVRGITISRTEFVKDVYSGFAPGPEEPTSFYLNEHQVNPGWGQPQDGVFSWLTAIARGYQQYRFKKLVFHYRSTSGDATGPNTSLGQVIMACEYDSTRPAFKTKQDMLNTMFAISGSPSESFDFIVECNSGDKRFKWWDVRSTAIRPEQNINLKDFIRFAIASVGVQTQAQQLGELHVSYEIEFTKYNYNDMGTLVPRALFYENRAVQPSNWDVGVDAPLGTVAKPDPWVKDPDSTLNVLLGADPSDGQRILLFPTNMTQGVFQIFIMWSGTVINPTVAPVPLLDNCEFVPWYGTAFQAPYLSNDNGAGGQQLLQIIQVRLTGPNAYIKWTAGAPASFPGELQYLQLSVTQIADDTNVPNLGPYNYS